MIAIQLSLRWLLPLALLSMIDLDATTIPSSDRSREVIQRVTPELKRLCAMRQLTLGSPIFIRIFKAEKELEVWMRQGNEHQLFQKYPVHYFSGTLGPKLKEGDHQAPEGFYFVTPGRMNPNSNYHLSFNLGYPNAYDRAHGRTGNALMVHGSTVSIGCFAMTDPLIEQIYTVAHRAFEDGQRFFRVHIFPFRLTDANMSKHTSSPHWAFWQNLKEGFDFFEQLRVDPDIQVKDGRYVFEPSGRP